MISPLEFEQRRTDSLPTPTCLATTAEAAATEEYSPRWSLTRRTARAYSSSSIFLSMVLILWTQTGAASNLERFSVPPHRVVTNSVQHGGLPRVWLTPDL